MISLGQHDPNPLQLDRFKESIANAFGANLGEFLKDDAGASQRRIQEIGTSEPMSVLEIQRALKNAGFFPGGVEDGIYGYRTRSAVRLFQEYVRSIEGHRCIPDGLFGRITRGHLNRWKDNHLKADWTARIDQWRRALDENNFAFLEDTEYGRWLTFLEEVNTHYRANPNKTVQDIEDFDENTDTVKPSEWNFGPDRIHMIGIRCGEANTVHKFNDVFILLVKGLVFKFQGSTEPGFSEHPQGKPFLVQGQHDYRFGWHRQSYLALRPKEHGVLVVRSKDFSLTDEDLAGGLSANTTINIHWGGRGVDRDVKKWSAGCQVIAGAAYVNHNDDPVSCAEYAATFSSKPLNSITKTRGAYNVLSDVVATFSGDMESSTVKYMLLMEDDLNLNSDIAALIGQARETAAELKQRIGA